MPTKNPVGHWLQCQKSCLIVLRIRHNIDLDPNPKETLINIARTSRNRSIREDLVPRQASGAKVGPLYVPRLIEFAEKLWRPDIAANESESLRRCILALSTLTSWEM
jgi:hypothetical protein